MALITGATSGIGLAAAVLFASEGCKVAVLARGEEGLRRAVEQIEAAGGTAFSVAADVRSAQDMEAAIAATVAAFGRLDILYNNAGVTRPKPLHQISEEEWDFIVDTDLKGVFFGCRYALPIMMTQQSGVILSTASVAGLEGRSAAGPYCAAKAGVIMLTKNIAMDYARYGIRANAICPGGAKTAITKTFQQQASSAHQERMTRWVKENLPIGRIADPIEVARVALFLVSDEASYVTGHAMVVDGGSIAGHSIPLVEESTATPGASGNS